MPGHNKNTVSEKMMSDTASLAAHSKRRQELRDEDVVEFLEKQNELHPDNQLAAVPEVITTAEEVDIPMVGRCTRFSHRDATTGELLRIEYSNRPPTPSEVVASRSESPEKDLASSCTEDRPIAIPFRSRLDHVPRPRPA